MQSKFLRCETCGVVVHQFGDDDKELSCCGTKLKELVPNTMEASVEKHIPVARVEGNKLVVQVGVMEHPQTEQHFIDWIYVKCGNRTQGVALTANDKPYAEFFGEWKGKVEVQASCNKHGIWLSTILC